MNHRQRIGKWGEELAEEYLSARGMQTMHKNYRTPYGELDLIMRDGEEIVMVEVKTRTNLSFGFPESGVSEKKRQHLVRASEAFFQEHSELNDCWRVDVVAIEGWPGNINYQIEWFKNAIS